jgi:hypothetical protein
MAVIATTKDLDVLAKYESLISESMGSNSVYIRTKETLEAMFANSSFTAREKGDILSKVLGSLNTSVVTASMSTALQWASSEKDIELKKLELAKQLDIMDREILLADANIDKANYESIAIQAQTDRMYGTPTVIDGALVSLADEGKTWYEIQLLKQQDINMEKEALILDSKLNESYAAIHKVVADTYVNYGAWSYTLGATGLSTAPLSNTGVGYDTLSSVQKAIAKEQANGYAYNAWANALTGTSSMLGTAIASELTAFGAGSTGETLINNANATASKLALAKVAYTEYQG